MLRATRSPARFPMRSIDFSIYLILSAALWLLFQSLTEMSTRNLPGSKVRSVRKADNFTGICNKIVWKVWDSRRPTTPWSSIALTELVLRFLESLIRQFALVASLHLYAS
jgi:hypothetical protein